MENWLISSSNRKILLITLAGLILIGFGVILFKTGGLGTSTKVEVLDATTEIQNEGGKIVVEISGEVEKPGVYNFQKDDRVDDLLIAAGGFSADADRVWIEQNLNRAAKLADGQKIYIPPLRQGFAGQASTSSITGNTSIGGKININTADAKTLDSLPGIGPAHAQNIIEHRPYSSTQDLLKNAVLTPGDYEKIKDMITVF
jgi:competence protein ComEA